jgi:hypothetical protein
MVDFPAIHDPASRNVPQRLQGDRPCVVSLAHAHEGTAPSSGDAHYLPNLTVLIFRYINQILEFVTKILAMTRVRRDPRQGRPTTAARRDDGAPNRPRRQHSLARGAKECAGIILTDINSLCGCVTVENRTKADYTRVNLRGDVGLGDGGREQEGESSNRSTPSTHCVQF